MSSHDAYMRSPYLSIKHSTYFPVYDKLFGPYAGRPITFVEIGVLNGGSLFMWRDFLGPEARIIGIDLNPEAKRWEAEGFEIFTGSQTNPKFWEAFFAEVGPVNVLLDDGGHTFEQQVVTASCALPHIRDGGILVVEDTHTSYMAEFGGPSPLSFIGWARNMVDGINRRFGRLKAEGNHETVVHSVRFFESIVAFEVDRRLCAIESRPTRNQGQSVEAKDQRHRDNVIVTATQMMKLFKY